MLIKDWFSGEGKASREKEIELKQERRERDRKRAEIVRVWEGLQVIEDSKNRESKYMLLERNNC